jgi:hypothetical protein
MTDVHTKLMSMQMVSVIFALTTAFVFGATLQVAAEDGASVAHEGYATSIIPVPVSLEGDASVDGELVKERLFDRGFCSIRGRGAKLKCDLLDVEVPLDRGCSLKIKEMVGDVGGFSV